MTNETLTHPLALAAAVLDDLAPRARLELLRIELLLAVRITAPVLHGDRFLLLLVVRVLVRARIGVRALELVRVIRR